MSEPTFGPSTERVYSLLPEHFKLADEENYWTLKRLLSALLARQDDVTRLKDRFAYISPEEGEGRRTSDLVDPRYANPEWLRWLSQLFGSQQVVTNPEASGQGIVYNPGTVDALIQAASRDLVGTKFVDVKPRMTDAGPGTLWDVTITTRNSETLRNLVPEYIATANSIQVIDVTFIGADGSVNPARRSGNLFRANTVQGEDWYDGSVLEIEDARINDPVLVANPDFEELEGGNPVGWSPSGAAHDYPTGLARTDDRCLRISPTSAYSVRAQMPGTTTERKIPSDPTKKFYFEAWVKTQVVGPSQDIGFIVQGYDAADVFVQNLFVVVNSGTLSTTSWTRVAGQVQFTNPLVTSIRYGLYAGGTGGSYLFDDVIVADVTAIDTPETMEIIEYRMATPKWEAGILPGDPCRVLLSVESAVTTEVAVEIQFSDVGGTHRGTQSHVVRTIAGEKVSFEFNMSIPPLATLVQTFIKSSHPFRAGEFGARAESESGWVPRSADPVASINEAGAKPAGIVLHHRLHSASWDTLEANIPEWDDWEATGSWNAIEETGL